MTKKTSGQSTKRGNVMLSSSSRLPLVIIAIGLAALALPNTTLPSILIISFGLFLLLQSFTLKLEFTSQELVVWQLDKELRKFPYKNWVAWKVLLPSLPGLLYFREEASPHLLPILFNSKELLEQLRLKVGNLEIKSSAEKEHS